MIRLHPVICYFNTFIIICYFLIIIFHLDMPSDNLPYKIQVTVLILLSLLPSYIVRNADRLLDIGGHNFSNDKISKKHQKQMLIFSAYILTLMMSWFSLSIINASINGLDSTSPMLSL